MSHIETYWKNLKVLKELLRNVELLNSPKFLSREVLPMASVAIELLSLRRSCSAPARVTLASQAMMLTLLWLSIYKTVDKTSELFSWWQTFERTLLCEQLIILLNAKDSQN